MKILEATSWSDDFFESYKNFRNKIHEEIENDFPLSIDDYKKFFGAESPFREDFQWVAIIVEKDGVRLSQGILCWRKDGKTGNLGFLDLTQDEEASSMLFQKVFDIAELQKLDSVKAPVDLNFFIKYRLKISGEKESFYGEPIYPSYYPSLLQESGFEVVGKWDTYEVDVWNAVKDFFKKREKVENTERKVSKGKINVRSIKLNQWDEELKIIYDLFIASYSKMAEFEPISFEQFKHIYDDFKYIIQPWLSYIVEYNGLPLGFCINYVDPLPVLKKIKNKKLSKIDKLLLVIKLRLSFKTLLISYVGKIPSPDGEEVKGVQIKVSKKLTPFSLMMNKVLVTYQNIDSPSRRSWSEAVLKPYSQYVLFGKILK